ncbi:hypothetical protein TrVFT333_006463 [Trichoderma virens FT-333]|nr:hypothetical protein TrVFT333_006463 [Trichoderma virens FT-333]
MAIPSADWVPRGNVDTPPAGQPGRNSSDSTQETLIHDLRGQDSVFDLDKDKFQIITNVEASSERSFTDDTSIKENYSPEVKQLLVKHIRGSNKIHIFDHTIRLANPGIGGEAGMRYFPEEAEMLLQGRYRIVNVWMPLNNKPVESFPLTFASTYTLEDCDVMPIEHRYPNGYTGETTAIKHNPSRKWYYLSGMTGSERLLLECSDSEPLKPGSGIGGRVPHTAFVDPRTREDAEARKSIEVRALVFGL